MQYPQDKVSIRIWNTPKAVHLKVVDTQSGEEPIITHIHLHKTMGWIGHHQHGGNHFVLTDWQSQMFTNGIFYNWR